MNATKMTITVKQSMEDLRESYRLYYGLNKNEKVNKKDIATWLGNLAEADVESILYNDEN